MKKRQSLEVNSGKIRIGGESAVALQSMLTANLSDLEACIKQVDELVATDCKLIRLAVISKKDIKPLKSLCDYVKRQYEKVALVADIHHHPELAKSLIGAVDKIRINPGNYLGNPKCKWNEESLHHAQLKIKASFREFIRQCAESGTVIRIGVNQGSLSDRIYFMHGNTSKGMVASAIELVKVCAEEKFEKVVISLKSSDVITMIESNRLFHQEQSKIGTSYPIHLGVTEAGNGIPGRVKSIFGISALLNEGIGDTIRVSLTENPVNEISVCKSILNKLHSFSEIQPLDAVKEALFVLNSSYEVPKDGRNLPEILIPSINTLNKFSVFASEEVIAIKDMGNSLINLTNRTAIKVEGKLNEKSLLKSYVNPIWLVEGKHLVENVILLNNVLENPTILVVLQNNNPNTDEFLVEVTNTIMPLLVNNQINGLWLSSLYHELSFCDKVTIELMQLAGKVQLKPNYIACPGCSRTLFNLEKITEEIQQKTRHLGGLKIGIMGCIINGLGEMGECDYGYVGAGKGKINIYKDKKLVRSGVAETKAVDELLAIIDTTN